MVEEVMELPPIGKSDSACQKWELTVKDTIIKNTTILRPNFKQANWTRIRNAVRNCMFDQSESVDGMTDRFVAMVDNAKKEHPALQASIK